VLTNYTIEPILKSRGNTSLQVVSSADLGDRMEGALDKKKVAHRGD
jgi:hypothetical protein